jgi:very-short-patch-repair endonuclease
VLRRNKPMIRRTPLRAKQVSRPDAQTRAESKLWALLRDNEVTGLSFRRRERVGPFVVDFLCPAARLVLLVSPDGDEHADAVAWLHQNGYRVLQFPAGEVLSNPRRILETIAQSFELRIVRPKN